MVGFDDGLAVPHFSVIRRVLNRLLSRPKGAFLVIEETASGRFIQYAGSIGESLILDVPVQTLSKSEMQKAHEVYDRLGYQGPQTYGNSVFPGGPPGEIQTSFIVDFGRDVEKAAELGLAVLYQVYGLDEDASLCLSEE